MFTLLLLIAVTTLAYLLHLLVKSKMNPRKSFGHFLLYVVLNLSIVFLMTFLFTFVLLKFKARIFQ